MAEAALLPTRKDEDFRYADLAALGQVWPVAVETIAVAAGEAGNLALVLDGDQPVARELAIVLGDGALFDLRVLTAPAAYGRVAVKVELGAGASFTLGAAQLAGGDQTVEIITDVLHAQPDAVSRQVVRSVAGGKATVN
ncbi:MAG: SufD family Fe-S cluster assembly protein, partial [Novosphingobium sp.]